ncbi:MAG: PKD domain-containing protein [Bacteroidota bacterium]
MKKHYLLHLFLLFLFYGSSAQNSKLEFVRNKGQWENKFDYKCISGTGDIYVHSNAITYLLGEQGAWDKIDAFKHGQIKTPPVIKYHAYRMVFENCLSPQVSESKIQPHYYNYFLGNDSSKWKSDIHPCLALDYSHIYTGIDMRLSSEGNNVKYDFIVAPNADASQIKLKFEGVDKLSISRDGSLSIQTSVGVVKEMKPVVFQYINDQKVNVLCNYVLNKNIVSFEFPEGYDHNQVLVIDPTVVFCTFTGSISDNWGFTATYDPLGNMYTGGLVNGVSYPVSLGAFQATFGGGTTTSGSFFPCDMGIMKINSTGTTKVYATYIGGSDNDQPHSMIVDKSNNLIIAGRTYSTNYPTSASAFDRTHNGGADIVVTVLNSLGTGIIGSTYVGGSGDDCVNFDAEEFTGGNLKHNYGDDARSEVIVDNSGNVYVTASTLSTNFPVQSPIQASLGGGQDAVLLKMNTNVSAMIFSTYLGGFNDDAGYVLTLNNAQNSIFVGGGTMSSNFPTTPGTYRPAFIGGTTDGYILKISNGPAYTLQRGTFIGATSYDQVYGVAIDANDDLYMMGQTLGGGFPVSPGVYSNPFSSQFVMKMNNNLTAPIYSTVYGSGSSSETNISPVAFLVDTCQNVYISGWGGTLGGPSFSGVGSTTGMPTTPTAIQTTTDGADFYFIVFSKNATSLLYGSFFGRVATNPLLGEHVDGGTSRFDKTGIVYQAICGGCGGPTAPASPFPTTPGSLSPTNGSTNCNLAALKIAFDLGAVVAKANADPDTKGCSPFTVNFKNTSTNAKTFDWDFVDGTPNSTLKEPTHTFYIPGTYRVRMVAHNPDACIEYDTSYVDIIVDSNSIHADFTYSIIDSCYAPYEVSFKNTSSYGKSGTASFIWDFGDGTAKYSGTTPPIHNYASTGVYIITLIMIDPLACNNPDTMRKTINIDSKFLKAATNLPDVICVQAGGLFFSNFSTNASSVFWDFGDGTTSTELTPTHKYDTGTYIITMVVYNSNACVTSDTFRKKITIRPGATADFDYTPKIPVENDSTHFTNLSKNALSYLWVFGDGNQSRAANPAHLYKRTGTFKTCLIAEGFENCNDTICKDISALIVPRIDVPTAFTPNGDGINDILYVRGAAIQMMDFSIYNRWGQLVFRTSSTEQGWDGTFNGKPQPMESYAYVLNATFINGETESKRGNITLLE